jgi:SAM-dependent methyltransferase
MPNGFACPECQRRFDRCHGVYRALTPERLAEAEPFLGQYRAVRGREGYRRSSLAYYRALPEVPPDDPHADEWLVRRQSYLRLRREVPPACGGSPPSVLDLGAGAGWLSHRFAADGWRTVAVDLLDDAQDGLGVCRSYPVPIVTVQADFEALPFAPGQFDAVVFNGSLHYARDVRRALARAREALAPGGVLAVVDSPCLRDEADGLAMVTDKLRRFRTEYGMADVVHPQTGFLTFDQLDREAARLGLQARFHRSSGPLAWRMRRRLSEWRIGRTAAAFGVWVAR